MSDPHTHRPGEEDTERQTDQMKMKEQHKLQREDESGDQLNGKSSEDKMPRKRAQKTGARKSCTCLQCGRSFTCRESLKVHMRIHTGEKPFKCQHCGKDFRCKATLTEHIRIHTGEKPFKCSHCGKSFAYRTYYKIHFKCHSNEKPYTCLQCGKSFAQKGYYNTHLVSHSTQRPFICPQCGKGFGSAVILKKHETTHSQVKPYHCDLCNRSYREASALQRHLKSVFHNKYLPLKKFMHQSGSSGYGFPSGANVTQSHLTASLSETHSLQ